MIPLTFLVITLIAMAGCLQSCGENPPPEGPPEDPPSMQSVQLFEWRVSARLTFSDGYRLAQSSPRFRHDDPVGRPGQGPGQPESGQTLDAQAMYRDSTAFFSLKDPTIVKHEGRWHLFCTRRAVNPSHSIEYLSFPDWNDETPQERVILPFQGRGVRSPQVFFYRPLQSWFLLFEKLRSNSVGSRAEPFFTSTKVLDDPHSWSPPRQIELPLPDPAVGWGDFWFISDQKRACLFMTSKEGRLFRAETTPEDFPYGWSEPVVCLGGDFIEAGHVYRVEEWDRYLAVIVASRYLKRYIKAYVAESLGGTWERIAVTRAQPFISPVNVSCDYEPWADSFGHGEIVRRSPDETMPIRIKDCTVLLPTVLRRQMNGKLYREVPWKLALLELFRVEVEFPSE